ncbi:uncharacterized protein LOC6645447 isoform X4 [Drosophila willistoni]|uniref:uncharacterized protein LOC6645447 isoform X4 n=1 Tax=Drosophila willistoni TaxID=7260 RepID=UPI000C26CA16|nr:uncharacterized protein LOC6645447 isoform X4 [Drosophila willistoni]
MSQQQQKRASASDAPHNEIINLDDDDEDGNGDGDEDDVQYLGTVYQQQHLNPVTVPVATVSTPTTDLYVSPSTSAQAQAASASCSSSTSTNATEETTAGDAGGASGCSNAVAPLECPICLQTCIHPARLPCGHIFCFLCVKGVAYKNRRCAMCRREIPAEFLDHPQLVNGIDDICATRATEDGYQWYYEGRNGGWWAFDQSTNDEINLAYRAYQQELANKKKAQKHSKPAESTNQIISLFAQSRENDIIDSDDTDDDDNDVTIDANEDEMFMEFLESDESDDDIWAGIEEPGETPLQLGQLRILICGQLYVIDMVLMQQYPANMPWKIRKLTKNKYNETKPAGFKGIAGLHAPKK